MSRIRSKNTTPEIAVRRLLHGLGFRFRLHRKNLPGTPDIALPKYKTIVFVHGCFWHGHSCRDGKRPKSRQSYWLPKLERNRRRHARQARQLRRLGWHVLTVWECQTRNPEKLGERLQRAIERNARKADGDRE